MFSYDIFKNESFLVLLKIGHLEILDRSILGIPILLLSVGLCSSNF
jgi:hypothetical protein